MLARPKRALERALEGRCALCARLCNHRTRTPLLVVGDRLDRARCRCNLGMEAFRNGLEPPHCGLANRDFDFDCQLDAAAAGRRWHWCMGCPAVDPRGDRCAGQRSSSRSGRIESIERCKPSGDSTRLCGASDCAPGVDFACLGNLTSDGVGASMAQRQRRIGFLGCVVFEITIDLRPSLHVDFPACFPR